MSCDKKNPLIILLSCLTYTLAVCVSLTSSTTMKRSVSYNLQNNNKAFHVPSLAKN